MREVTCWHGDTGARGIQTRGSEAEARLIRGIERKGAKVIYESIEYGVLSIGRGNTAGVG